MNIVNCAMFAAFYLQLPEKPDMDALTAYYNKSMMISPMRWFCRMGGKKKFSEKDIAGI